MREKTNSMAFKMKGYPEPLVPKQATLVPSQSGRKEVHNGKDVYPSLDDVRKQISAERIELLKSGASEAELKAFDTHANKRISELSKKS